MQPEHDLEIRTLGSSDAAALSELVSADPPQYRRYFEPFPGGRADVDAALDRAERDSYWGIFSGDELLALIMLRGLDAGFLAPAFGVYVAQRHSGRGLGSSALAFAEAWCRLNDCDEVMLTVHPEHERAQRLYEDHGFAASGHQSAIGHLIYRKSLRAVAGVGAGAAQATPRTNSPVE